MGARAEQLAKKFDESCAEFNKVVEGLSDADWKKVTSAEKWPVGVVAHHLAEGDLAALWAYVRWLRQPASRPDSASVTSF